MKRLLWIGVLCFSSNLLADEWHQGFQGVCDLPSQKFRIDYIFGYNKDGDALVKEKTKISQSKCVLNGNEFTLKPEFKLGHPEGKGRCGAHRYVRVFIYKNGSEIFSKRLLADCHHSNSYISSIEVDASGELNIKRVSGYPY